MAIFREPRPVIVVAAHHHGGTTPDRLDARCGLRPEMDEIAGAQYIVRRLTDYGSQRRSVSVDIRTEKNPHGCAAPSSGAIAPHHQHHAGRMIHHPVGDAAHKEALQIGHAPMPHDDQVYLVAAGIFDDSLCRMA